MTDKPDACPCCGGAGTLYLPTCSERTPYDPTDRAYPFVRCGSCYAEVPGENWDHSGKSAVAKWNRRFLPEGSVVVPREPTRQMCLAAREAQASWPIRDEADSPVVTYRAMIAAATEDAP